MTIVVTGASGFVGLNVVEALLQGGRAVVALSHDAFPPMAREAVAALPGNLVAVEADITASDTLARLFREHRVEGAIHLAAVTPAADVPATQASRILDVNVVGTLALFEAALAAKLRRVVYASSGAVYGNAVFRDPAPDESSPLEPTSLYGLTKLLGERLMRRFRDVHGLDVVSARLGAVFGPWERDTGLRATLSPPFQIARIAVRSQEARLVTGGERDWIYGRDVARSIVALHDAPRLAHDTYNITAPAVWNAGVVAAAMAAAMPDFSWRIVPSVDEANIQYFTPLEEARRAPRIDRLRADLGITTGQSPAIAAADYAGWVVRHRAFFA